VTGQVRPTSSLADQLIAAAVGGINEIRIEDGLVQAMNQDAALAAALAEMQKVSDFIGAPENILGSASTKHGEIAEQVEVAFRRAWDCLAQDTPTATFEGVGRTDQVDYIINDVAVQSKFINGVNASLRHVIEHLKQYEGFCDDGGYFHISKDQHAIILKAIAGDTTDLGLNQKTINAILSHVKSIEEITGKSFTDAVQPSVSAYSEVQQNVVAKTLDGHEKSLKEQNEAIKDQINDAHQPSIAEGLKATGVAAAVGATVGFASVAIRKFTKEKKNLFAGDYTDEDWREIGGESFKSGIVGGVTGGVVYGLTNFADLSAPMAGAMVAAVKGLAPLIKDYQAGKISMDALVDGGMFVCSDVAIVGMCTVAGQTLIPVPLLGAMIGSVAGKILNQLLSSKLQGMQKAVDAKMALIMGRLDSAYALVVAKVTADIERLGSLTALAFDLSTNIRLIERSLDLAREYGVPDHLLIKSEPELDRYMLS
jgi:hypothetical protein